MDLKRATRRALLTAAVVGLAGAQAEALADAGPDCVAATAAADRCPVPSREQLAERRRREDAAGVDAVPERTSLYRALREMRAFHFAPGDVVLLRSAEAMSAAVSQIGLQPAFFSHMAIIGLDARWDSLEVVEAGVDEGLRSVAIDDWLEQDFARVAVFRHRDPAIARRAAIAAYTDASARRGQARDYDLALALDDPARLYCSEVVTRAYASAAPDAPRVPDQLSSIGNLTETFPLSALGVHDQRVFIPDDLELDPRFSRQIELRVPALLAQVDAQDRALRRLFDGLRGPGRAQTLAAIDALRPSGAFTFPLLMRSGYSAYLALPEDARARFVGLSRLLARELDPQSPHLARAHE